MFLLDKDKKIDHVVGLEFGADDYMSKTFDIREVNIRIKAIAWRCFPIKSEIGGGFFIC